MGILVPEVPVPEGGRRGKKLAGKKGGRRLLCSPFLPARWGPTLYAGCSTFRTTDTDFLQEGAAPPCALPVGAVAEAISFALDQPSGVDLNTLTIRPIGQPA